MQNMSMQQPQPTSMDQNGFPMDTSGNYTLPAALLAQYPALATLSWAQGVDDDPSGRSSFDASGSEYYEEDDGGYVSADPSSQQYGGQQYQQQESAYNGGGGGGYSSDIGGR